MIQRQLWLIAKRRCSSTRLRVLALQNMAYLYGEKLAQPDKAILALSRLIEIEPGNAAIVVSRGVFYARLNQHSAAIADATKALKLNDDAMTHYRAACIYANIATRSGRSSSGNPRVSCCLQKQPALVGRANRDPDLKSIKSTRSTRNSSMRLHD